MRLPRLADARECPFIMVDVGAAEGIHDRWHDLLPDLKVIGFEPDERSFAELDKSSPFITFLNVGLGRQPGTETIYLTRKPTCSSTYRPNTVFLNRFPDPRRYDVVETLSMPVQSLDAALAEYLDSSMSIDFVKLDVHGAELAILDGATNAIESGVLGWEIELCMNPIWEGQALFHEVMAKMTKIGFELFDFRPYYWRRNERSTGQVKGQIVFGDALFFRSPEAIHAMAAGMNDRRRARAKVLHGISAFLIYGYKDCAEATLNFCADMFSPAEHDELARCWESQGFAVNLVDFLLRRRKVHRVVDGLRHRTSPGGRLYYAMEPRLGNYPDPL